MSIEFVVILFVFVGLSFLGGFLIGKKSVVPPVNEDAIKFEAINNELKNEIHKLAEQKRLVEQSLLESEKNTSKTLAEKQSIEERLANHKEEVGNLNQQFQEKFENLANKIITEKASAYKKESEQSISNLLNPLKEKISDFQKKVEDVYGNEAKERHSLKDEISRMVDANKKMSEEAQNLTKALKGDKKIQGDWGELILERILEAAGLCEGREFTTQGREMGLKTDEGRLQKPDVIINLPDKKHIIVDSKVSLVSYERYSSSDSKEDREASRKQFTNSLKKHIDDLSGKKYHIQEKLQTPEFVLLFVPLEGAFSLALQADKDLFSYAWDKSIIIVSPTTLLATLRTVASIWKQERQNKNALNIATESGRLYDKFHGFLGDMESIGKKIQDSDTAYQSAINKLSTGTGNIVSRFEKMKKLGAKATKQISDNFIDEETRELED